MRRRCFLAGAGAWIAAPVQAEFLSGAAAIAGDRFIIGNQEYHLADITAPSAYGFGKGAIPYFDESKIALQKLVGSATLIIADVAPATRWGARIVTASLTGQSRSLQEVLIEQGAVRVAPQTDSHEFIDRLLRVEAASRKARRGLWALDDYRVFDALDAGNAIGAYHLVEGVVVRATSTRSRFYLNFGEDYRTDFTAGARNAVYRKWMSSAFDLAVLEGERLLVRGYVNNINGPSIDLKHIRQIEVAGAS